jgi:allantoinase
MFDLIIRGGLVIHHGTIDISDIGIADGHIAVLGIDLTEPAKRVIDAAGLVVLPGCIDIHVHFNEPGNTEWEGIASGSRALAAGGGTLFCDMPLNSIPCVIHGDAFRAKLRLMQQKSITDFGLWGGLVPGNIDQLADMAELGAVGFKAFMSNSGLPEFAAVDDDTLYHGMLEAARLELVVAVHAENDSITQGLGQRLGRNHHNSRANDHTTWREMRPVVAELEAVSRAIVFAQQTGCQLHIVHVSSQIVADYIREAKRTYPKLSMETCPHYVFFDESEVEQAGVVLKCAPPIREAFDQPDVQLNTADYDLVASDHSPAPPSMKNPDDYLGSWGGISGVQSTLNSLMSLSIKKPGTAELGWHDIARLTSAGPAKILGLANKGEIRVGFDADFVVVEPNTPWVLQANDLYVRHQHSPYVGQSFGHKPRYTIRRGEVLMRDGLVVSDGLGRQVKPQQRR